MRSFSGLELLPRWLRKRTAGHRNISSAKLAEKLAALQPGTMVVMVTRILGITAGVSLTLFFAVTILPSSANGHINTKLSTALHELLSLHALCWLPVKDSAVLTSLGSGAGVRKEQGEDGVIAAPEVDAIVAELMSRIMDEKGVLRLPAETIGSVCPFPSGQPVHVVRAALCPCGYAHSCADIPHQGVLSGKALVCDAWHSLLGESGRPPRSGRAPGSRRCVAHACQPRALYGIVLRPRSVQRSTP
jgi:hypothetical protein